MSNILNQLQLEYQKNSESLQEHIETDYSKRALEEELLSLQSGRKPLAKNLKEQNETLERQKETLRADEEQVRRIDADLAIIKSKKDRIVEIEKRFEEIKLEDITTKSNINKADTQLTAYEEEITQVTKNLEPYETNIKNAKLKNEVLQKDIELEKSKLLSLENNLTSLKLSLERAQQNEKKIGQSTVQIGESQPSQQINEAKKAQEATEKAEKDVKDAQAQIEIAVNTISFKEQSLHGNQSVIEQNELQAGKVKDQLKAIQQEVLRVNLSKIELNKHLQKNQLEVENLTKEQKNLEFEIRASGEESLKISKREADTKAKQSDTAVKNTEKAIAKTTKELEAQDKLISELKSEETRPEAIKNKIASLKAVIKLEEAILSNKPLNENDTPEKALFDSLSEAQKGELKDLKFNGTEESLKKIQAATQKIFDSVKDKPTLDKLRAYHRAQTANYFDQSRILGYEAWQHLQSTKPIITEVQNSGGPSITSREQINKILEGLRFNKDSEIKPSYNDDGSVNSFSVKSKDPIDHARAVAGGAMAGWSSVKLVFRTPPQPQSVEEHRERIKITARAAEEALRNGIAIQLNRVPVRDDMPKADKAENKRIDRLETLLDLMRIEAKKDPIPGAKKPAPYLAVYKSLVQTPGPGSNDEKESLRAVLLKTLSTAQVAELVNQASNDDREAILNDVFEHCLKGQNNQARQTYIDKLKYPEDKVYLISKSLTEISQTKSGLFREARMKNQVLEILNSNTDLLFTTRTDSETHKSVVEQKTGITKERTDSNGSAALEIPSGEFESIYNKAKAEKISGLTSTSLTDKLAGAFSRTPTPTTPTPY